jgi:hypothetical protein
VIQMNGAAMAFHSAQLYTTNEFLGYSDNIHIRSTISSARMQNQAKWVRLSKNAVYLRRKAQRSRIRLPWRLRGHSWDPHRPLRLHPRRIPDRPGDNHRGRARRVEHGDNGGDGSWWSFAVRRGLSRGCAGVPSCVQQRCDGSGSSSYKELSKEQQQEEDERHHDDNGTSTSTSSAELAGGSFAASC